MKNKSLIGMIVFVIGILVTSPAWTVDVPIPGPGGKRENAPSPTADSGSSLEVSADSSAELITLELKNIDVVEVIKILSKKGDMNVVIAPNVKGRVTMFLKNVDIRTAFLTVLEATELAYTENNGILSVLPAKLYEANTGAVFYDERDLVAIPIQNAAASDVAGALTKLKPKATIIVDERTNSLLIRDNEEGIDVLKSAVKELDRTIVTENFQLLYLRQKTAEELIKILLGKRGSYFINPRVNQVVIKDYPENVAAMVSLLKAHDIPTPLETRAYELDYAKYDAVEAKIKLVLTPEIGQVIADERTNKILVSDVPSNFEQIEKLVNAYDTKDRQVLIEAKIVQVILNDQFQWGINWQTIIEDINSSAMGLKLVQSFEAEAGKIVAGTGFAQGIDILNKVPELLTPDVDSSTTTISDSSTTTDGLTNKSSSNEFSRSITTTNETTEDETSPFNQVQNFPVAGGGRIIATGTINGRQFEGVLNALKGVGNVEVLSSPRIITLNNEEAKIEVAEKEAYVTATTVTPGSGPSTTSENVTFIDVGIALSVTPTINKQDYITIKVKPSISTVTDEVETASGNTIPIVARQEIESKIQVKNGSTIVLGGLHEQVENKAESSIPFIGNIPLLGNLFKKINNRLRNSELVMFITPHIITGEKSFYEDEPVAKMLSGSLNEFMKKMEVYPKARAEEMASHEPELDVI